MLLQAKKVVDFAYADASGERRLEPGETVSSERIHPRQAAALLAAGDLVEVEDGGKEPAAPVKGRKRAAKDEKPAGESSEK